MNVIIWQGYHRVKGESRASGNLIKRVPLGVYEATGQQTYMVYRDLEKGREKERKEISTKESRKEREQG